MRTLLLLEGLVLVAPSAIVWLFSLILVPLQIFILVGEGYEMEAVKGSSLLLIFAILGGCGLAGLGYLFRHYFSKSEEKLNTWYVILALVAGVIPSVYLSINSEGFFSLIYFFPVIFGAHLLSIRWRYLF